MKPDCVKLVNTDWSSWRGSTQTAFVTLVHTIQFNPPVNAIDAIDRHKLLYLYIILTKKIHLPKMHNDDQNNVHIIILYMLLKNVYF